MSVFADRSTNARHSDLQSCCVVSIGGASRSGSTLLNLLLGNPDEFLPVGELRYVWSRGYRQNMLCGCGTPFRECSFWRAVMTRAYGDFDKVPAADLEALQASVGEIWHLPALLSPTRTRRFDRRVDRFVAHLALLCDALREVSGAGCIVDSSKLPSYCYLLSIANGHQGRLIHLVRDSRAVAFSFSKKKRKPDVHWREAYMKRFSPFQSAIDWNALNLAMEAVGARLRPRCLVRYEDLADDPQRAIASLGLPGVNGVASGDWDGEVALRTNHTVSGNPLRFVGPSLMVRPDTEWRTRMRANDRRLVTALTLPMLARYGYLSR